MGHVTATAEVTVHLSMGHVTVIQDGWETAVRQVSPS